MNNRALRIGWHMVILSLLFSGCAGGLGGSPTPTFIPRDYTPGAVTSSSPDETRQEFYVSPEGSDQNPGTLEQPWGTIHHAAETLQAGQTVFIRGGTYAITRQIRVKNSGHADGWITFAGYPGEAAVIDADAIDRFPPASAPPYPHDNGAFQIEGVSYIRVRNLAVTRSHNAGFTIRDSHHIDLINNRTDQTFSSGIAAWDTNHNGEGTSSIRVLGNTITKATTWDMIPQGKERKGEPPHEAISIAGAVDFEVAFNLIYNSDKEGIDVKETSRRGKVHHNVVHHVDRQAYYVDAWFGKIEDIEIFENVSYGNRGAGVIVSVENGELVENVRIHHNLIFDNLGAGIFFSRWGDGPRKNIQVTNNTVVHNGYGPPNPPDPYFWMTGGLYLYSANLEGIEIRDNIFSDNAAYPIAYSSHYLAGGASGPDALAQKQIVIAHNLIDDRSGQTYPIRIGWPPDDYADAYGYNGADALTGDPLFADPAQQDFSLLPGSPALGTGAYPDGSSADLWWQGEFPPAIQE